MGFRRSNATLVEYPTLSLLAADGAAEKTLHTLTMDEKSGYHFEGCIDCSALLVAAIIRVKVDVKGDGTFVEVAGKRLRYNPAGTTEEQAPAKHISGIESARAVRVTIQSDAGEAADRSLPAYFIAEELTR